MAWWHKPSAQTPRSRWNLNDYHTAFAATSKAQIEPYRERRRANDVS